MSSTWRNAAPRRIHKERAQPGFRAHMGLLEKHKDYTIRAQDYAKKSEKLKSLKRRAEERNPDEFNFQMTKTKTRGGVHVVERPDTMTGDLYKLLKTQDLGYVQTVANIEDKKIESLKSSLSFLDSKPSGKHTVFVESEEEAKSFDPVEFLDTAPGLVERVFNRPRVGTLSSTTILGAPASAVKEVKKETTKAYVELSERLDRADKLHKARDHLVMQRNLLAKGRRVRVKAAEGDSPAVFKWKPQRKK